MGYRAFNPGSLALRPSPCRARYRDRDRNLGRASGLFLTLIAPIFHPHPYLACFGILYSMSGVMSAIAVNAPMTLNPDS